ncbi:MAG: 4'-phosphopantetheinyl transferase superfamily protein [Clostridia bacterium]|nr:4'-phosphopantetheinyl transferase superfamily protein [Clostridia bacterium]
MIYLSLKKCGKTLSEQRASTKELMSDMLISLGYNDDIQQKDDKGRPFLQCDNGDVSVSHCPELCAVAVLTENLSDSDFSLVIPQSGQRIGIDIEEIPEKGDIARYTRIAKRFLNTDVETADDFLRAWTRKEAYGKMVGDGLFSKPGIPCHYLTFTVESNNKRYILTISVKQRIPT